MNTGESLCPICHLGRLRQHQVTYTQVFEDKFIVIPNVSALVCDVCGEKVFDNEMLRRLSGLLGIERHNLNNVVPWQSWI
jgi:YgiT-type zinc finger domain-containing protein